MKRIKTLAAILTLALPALAPVASAQPSWVQEARQSSPLVDVRSGNNFSVTTDYRDSFVEATGGATADMKSVSNKAHACSIALRTARYLAYEKLSEQTGEIVIAGNTNIRNELLVNSQFQGAIQKILKSPRIISENCNWNPDGTPWAEVKVGILLGGTQNALMGPVTDWVYRTYASPPPPAAQQPQALEPLPPLTFPQSELNTASKEAGEYTGVIVDAGGLGARPAMYPRILAASGEKEVYSPRNADRLIAMNQGHVGYEISVDRAKSRGRAGSNPLVVKAASVAGAKKADVVISNEDALKIEAADLKQEFLKQCKVMFVVN